MSKPKKKVQKKPFKKQITDFQWKRPYDSTKNTLQKKQTFRIKTIKNHLKVYEKKSKLLSKNSIKNSKKSFVYRKKIHTTLLQTWQNCLRIFLCTKYTKSTENEVFCKNFLSKKTAPYCLYAVLRGPVNQLTAFQHFELTFRCQSQINFINETKRKNFHVKFIAKHYKTCKQKTLSFPLENF